MQVQLVARHLALGDYDSAESLIRNVLIDNPENPGMYEIWALSYTGRGKIHLAIPKMEMAHKLRPGDVYPAFWIVTNYIRLDDTESAQKWLEIAQARGPGSRWANQAARMLDSYLGPLCIS